MKPFKIQNRTLTSRRVKFIKNGGLITFTKDSVASFVENSREAGFCLTAITPIPPDDRGTKSIQLTGHPMGTDGRVSLYVDNNLTESIRYSNLARLEDRIAWFNQHFGTIIRYSGRAFATFESLVVGVHYRLVFEDDDIDFEFGEFGLAEASTNPTLYVEQYRLAFDLFNNKVEISCDGAEYQTPYMNLSGNWKLEINGTSYTSQATTIEQVLELLDENDIEVVVEGEVEDPEEEEQPVKNYSFRASYDSVKKVVYGYHTPGRKVALSINGENEELSTMLYANMDGKGRWSYPYEAATGVNQLAIVEYTGDISEINGDEWPTLELYGALNLTFDSANPPPPVQDNGDIIDTAFRAGVPARGHLYFKVNDSELDVTEVDFGFLAKDLELPLEQIPLAFAMHALTTPNASNSTLSQAIQAHSNIMEFLQRLEMFSDAEVAGLRETFAFLDKDDVNVIPVEPVTFTFYRGMKTRSTDLFEILFPDVVEPYVTLTATGMVDFSRYLFPVNVAPTGFEKQAIATFITPTGNYVLGEYRIDDNDNITFASLPPEVMTPYMVDEIRPNNLVSITGVKSYVDGKYLVIREKPTDSRDEYVYFADHVHERKDDGSFEYINSYISDVSMSENSPNVVSDDVMLAQYGSGVDILRFVKGGMHTLNSASINQPYRSRNIQLRPNMAISVGQSYSHDSGGWTIMFNVFAYDDFGLNLRTATSNNVLLRQTDNRNIEAVGHVELSEMDYLISYGGMLFHAVVDDNGSTEVSADVVQYDHPTIVSVGSCALTVFKETDEYRYFIQTRTDATYGIYRVVIATGEIEEILGQAQYPYADANSYEEPIAIRIAENRLLVTDTRNYPPLHRIVKVDETTGELTNIPYTNYEGKYID